MKISYAAPSATPTYITLWDESAGTATVKDWRPVARLGTMQKENLAVPTGALNSAFRAPLGNVTTTVAINLTSIYSSRAAALAAARTTQAALLGTVNHYQVVQDSETQYLPHGVVEELSAEVQGCSVTYIFTIYADLVTATAPTT